jgi:Uma2 family endonuclease
MSWKAEVEMPVSDATYEQLALEDPEGRWELDCGRLRQKPAMTTEHEDVIGNLNRALIRQLDDQEFITRPNSRLRRRAGSYYIPDLFVVPRALARRHREDQPRTLDVYEQPLPLVVEVWSPSTGRYDVRRKVAEYRRRGDAEIWLIHPYERTLTAWQRQPDGSYTRSIHRGGTIQPAALPTVTITIERLFD